MRKKLYLLLVILPILFAVFGWLSLLIGGRMSYLPFGAPPSLILIGLMASAVSLWLCILLCILFYGLLILSLIFLRTERQWALVTVTLIFCLDMAASVVLTVISWLFLIAVVLDAGWIGLMWVSAYLGKRSR